MKSTIHLIFSILLGLFFIYAGIQKFVPKERKANSKATADLVMAVQHNDYPKPVPFQLAVKMMSISGFLKMVGILQILSGLLILIPKTRMGGLIFLLPITLNIFCLHFFMDGRVDENIETGSFLILNLVLLLCYIKSIRALIGAKI